MYDRSCLGKTPEYKSVLLVENTLIYLLIIYSWQNIRKKKKGWTSFYSIRFIFSGVFGKQPYLSLAKLAHLRKMDEGGGVVKIK